MAYLSVIINHISTKWLLVVALSIFSINIGSAQTINEGFEEPIWTSFTTGAGGSASGQVVITEISANSIMTYLSIQGTSNTSTATNTCPNSGTWWYSKAISTSSNTTKLAQGCHSITHSIKLGNSGYIVTPLSTAAVVNVTFWMATNGSLPLLVGLATDPNASQALYNSTNSAAIGAFTNQTSTYTVVNSSLTSYNYSGSFSGPCRFGVFNSTGASVFIDDIMVYLPTGTAPSISTNSATPTINNAIINGTVSPGTLPLLNSGVIWSITPLTGTIGDTLKPKTKDFPAAINISDTASPLQPNTTYFTEVYVIGLDGSFYAGAVIQFTTNATKIPVVITGTTTSVLSYQATAGGVIVDSGGCTIIRKGVCYGTSLNPTISGNNTIDGNWGTTYSSIMKPLLPNQLYHYRAYTINSCFPNTVSYGADSTFTTQSAVPSLTALPATINFGNEFIGTNAVVLSYVLKGNALLAGDSITINSPVGYTISLSPNGSFNSVLVYHYSGTSFSKPVYVKLSTANFGTFSGIITHTGGGAVSPNVDVESVSGAIVQSPAEPSNMGTDFWCGYPFEENMKSKPKTVDDTYGLILYIATGSQSSTVTVDLPLLPAALKTAFNFPRTITVAPNTVAQVQGFPIGDFTPTNTTGKIDSRLYFTGITNRGIHVESTNGIPVAVWLYSYATNSSAGGSMLFPTNTWNSSYTVQAYGGKSNNSYPNSFFFVIANQDNTPVTFTPSNDIIDSSATTILTEGHQPSDVLYHQDSTYTIVLNKGQVFNAMGFIQGSGNNNALGLDLSGTKVSTSCDKKIAVFGGNGRCLINTLSSTISACNSPTGGSDNLVQQMLPKVAWGTKYLTVPTKTMEYNVFRITVSDPITVVKVNGKVYNSNWNARGLYYELEGNTPFKIESDRPVNVTQFITSGDCQSSSIGNNGLGDPEMIILSPVQQSITSTTVLTPDFKNKPGSGGDYINVIIPHSGVSSFKLDGKTTAIDTGASSYTGAPYTGSALINMVNAFRPHPQDTSYYWAKFRVNYPATHSLTANVGFNAIAYGLEDGESWGFNAGTSIKNLSAPVGRCNPFGPCEIDSSGGNVVTCVDNPVKLQIALPYPPYDVDSIIWNDGVNNFIAPFSSTNTGKIDTITISPLKTQAHYDGTVVQGGDTFYIYSSPVLYTFSSGGIYDITATAMGKFASDCPGISLNHIYVQVGNDVPLFTAIPAGCGSTKVTFTDMSTALPGASITKWIWDFGEGAKDSSINPANPNPTINPHVYLGLNKYTATLKTINSIGCYAVDTVSFDLAFGIAAKFVTNTDTICPGGTIAFTDSSSTNASSWKWHFGDTNSGANDSSTLQNPTHTYTKAGIYITTLQVFTSGGCPSNIFKDTIFVAPLPKPNFIFGGVCLPGSTVFTNTSDTATGLKPYTYLWNFGVAGATSTATDGIYTYTPPVPAGGYIVKLIATNAFGCTDSISQTVSTIYAKPTAYFSVVKPDICLGDKANFTDNNNSTATNQTITQWHWAFGDAAGTTTTTTTNSTSNLYGSLGTYNVKLVVVTDKGCMSDSSVAHTVTVHPLPTPAFVLPGSCLSSGSVTFTNTSTISSGDPLTYIWTFTGGNPINSTATDGITTFKDTGTYVIILKPTSSYGCTASDTASFNVAGSQPIPSFTITNAAGLCSNLPVTITDNSTIALGIIKKVEIYWNYTSGATPDTTDNNPSKGLGGTKSYTHVYPVSGTDQVYNIRLVAYSGTTCFHDTIISITVHGIPVPAFIMPGSCLGSGSVTFMDNSTTGSGAPLTSSWTFGDIKYPPNTSTATNGVHTFFDTGNYTITQTVTTTFGCKASDTAQFAIAGSQPRPEFYVQSGNHCSNLPVTITDTSRIDVGKIKTVEIYWDYQGQSVPDITDVNPQGGKAPSSKSYTYTYPVLGYDKVYTIKLVAYSGPTCFKDYTDTITVHGSPKLMLTSAMKDVCLNALPVTINEVSDANGLTGTFTYSCPSAPLTIVGGNTFDPTKTSPGTYTIQAIYTTTSGCADTTSMPIRVLGLPLAHPIASYPLCERRAITFSDSSNPMGGRIDTTIWIINGNIIYGSPYTYNYPTSVNDVVKLVVKTICSSDTAKLGLFINPLPQVNFKFDSSVCLPKGTTQFTDLTTLPGTVQPVFTYNWDFGSGSGANPRYAFVADPTHDFPVVADYNITLKVTSSVGCDSSLTKTLLSTQIHPAPVSSYTLTPASAHVCLGDSILFTDNSGANINKSIWYFGDNNIVTAISTFHTYGTATNYTATHAVIDNNNCISVNNPPIPVIIDALPRVDAGYDKFVVIGDSVVLNEVTVVATNFTSWWTSSPYNPYLNDTTILNPVFKPTDAGTFSDTLHVRTQAGCSAWSVINLVALNPPIIPNVFSPNGDGVHDRWEIGYLNKFPGATVKVFNRYGQLIYNVIGYAVPWDGTCNGNPLPIGTYYYIISPKNGVKDLIGSVTIIR